MRGALHLKIKQTGKGGATPLVTLSVNIHLVSHKPLSTLPEAQREFIHLHK